MKPRAWWFRGSRGKEGAFHARQMLGYGTVLAAGVTPGKGGKEVEGVSRLQQRSGGRRTGKREHLVHFRPTALCRGTPVMEAAYAGIKVAVCITEGIPVLDMVRVMAMVRDRGTVLIGPNCPGIISPGKTKVGIMPGPIHRPGGIGVISRSGTLTYEVVDQLTRVGLGQSTCIGIGGDPIIGTSFIDHLSRFREDPDTEAVVLIGEIGGTAEEEAAQYIQKAFPKPVVAFIAGRTAPPGKRMGHAGAIISGGKGRAEDKIAALESSGITVVHNLGTLGETVRKVVDGR